MKRTKCIIEKHFLVFILRIRIRTVIDSNFLICQKCREICMQSIILIYFSNIKYSSVFFRGYNLQVIPMSIVSIFQCLYYFEYTRRYGIKKLPIGLAPIGLPILLPPIGFARSLCLLDISISRIWGSDGSCDRQSQSGIVPPLIVKFNYVVLL